MRWSWRLGTIRGIDIKVHITFLLALAWGGFIWGNGQPAGIAYGVLLTIALFVVVVLHELGHSIAAQHYGIPVYDIVLLPIGGVARLSHMPERPAQELVVALAGPAVNLVLTVITAPIVAASMIMNALSGGSLTFPAMTHPGLLNFTAFMLMVNVSLLLFNMLPAFPMDGGRVLRALLAMRLSHGRATRIAVGVGRAFAVVFGLLAILSGNIFLGVVAFFVFNGAGAEGAESSEMEPGSGLRPQEAMAGRAPVLLADTPAHTAFDRLMRSPYAALAVVDQRGDLVGLVTRAGMQSRWAAGVRGPVSLFVERPVQLATDAYASESRP